MDYKHCIATATFETEAYRIKALLHDLGVPMVWVSPCEIIGGFAVSVRPEDARGAYVRLQSAGEAV